MPIKLSLSFGEPAKSPSAQKRTPTFHAVSIWPAQDACQAALDAKGARVLSENAPSLPLERCDRSAKCECRYRHFEDRRDRPRRHVDGAPPSAAAASEEERRGSHGRRGEDYPDFDFDDDVRDEHADTYFGFRRKPQ